VFPDKKGRPVTQYMIWYRHQNTLKKAGLPEFVPYVFRHTALTRLGELGCDAYTLAKIAGHTSITISTRMLTHKRTPSTGP
jgi:integrase